MLMTRDEIVAAFGRHENGTWQMTRFELVENPPSKRRDLAGLMLLDAMLPGTGRIISAAEHDRIWLDVDVADLAGKITDEQVLMLVRCGIHWDDEVDSLTMSA